MQGIGSPDRAQAPTQRLLRHLVAMAALEDAGAVADALLRAALDVTAFDSALLARRQGGLVPVAAIGPLARVLTGADHEQLAAWAQDAGAPRPAGTEALIATPLAANREMLGLLVVASAAPAILEAERAELLEQLAAHAAACLRAVDTLRALRERAATDPLTGLGHHATFHEALAASHRRPSTAVVVCDIDGFKHLNDAHGHGYGDRVLCGVAEAMSGALRRGDRLFRIGGDEFAALLAVESETEAFDAAARLRQAVNAARLGVTISIGVAVPHHDEPDASVLARADRALYAVKDGGRDGVALANDEPLPAAPALG